MKFSLLAYCVALFVSCATPVPTDAWSEGTLVIAITLEKSAQSLATDTSRVFGDYRERISCGKVEVVARAFNDLHGRLLQTKITAHFGIDLDTHHELVMGIGEASSASEALIIASYGTEVICWSLALATEGVDQQLEHLNQRLIELYAVDSAPLLQQNQLLLERQQRYQTVVNPRYDAEFELKQVAAEIAANQSLMNKMLVASNEINAMGFV